MATSEERYAKGIEVRTRLGGGKPPAAPPPHYNLSEGMYEWITASLFGDVWGRPGLDIKIRSIATISALTVLGREEQLRSHLNNALNIGWTKDELAELLRHLVFYGGLPAALNGLKVAQQVFDERGL